MQGRRSMVEIVVDSSDYAGTSRDRQSLRSASPPRRIANARRLETLRAYVLVSQTEPLVEVYRRSGDVWQYQAAGPGQRLKLDDELILDIDALYHSGLVG
jgi:hypothetical protein